MGTAQRIATDWDDGAVLRAVRTVLAAAILLCLLVTFEPFQSQFEGPAFAGNAVNQIGYGLLAAAAVVCHLAFTPPPVLRALLRPAWLVLAALLVLSSFHSPWPDAALRAVFFTLAAMIAASAVLTLPPDAVSFRMVLLVGAFGVLGLSYAGIVLLPGQAIHGGGGMEPQHAGLWRGIYSHKNVAGPVMAALFFAGIYLVRCRMRAVGLAICLLSCVFVLKTGSKTTLALLPAVSVLVIGARILGGRLLPVLIVSAALVAMGLMTIGTVLSPTLHDLLQWLLPGTTFTGRLDIWRFALGVLGDRSWTGMGFESFWTRPVIQTAEIAIELTWDPRGIVNAHSGYLDLAIALGWPGLAIAMVSLALLPLRDFLRAGGDTERERLADLLLMILTFALLNAFLESFFLARANPIWVVMWLSIVGLRLLAFRPRA